ncbi:MAG: hypothetical protein WC770_03500 [Phycisphaerae bacterium]|jgi:hypothetical protein
MIQFNCPNCAKNFIVDPKHSGKDARCSQCKSIIKIPSQETPISKSDFAGELQMPPCPDEKTDSVQNRYAEHYEERQQQTKKWGNETERTRFWLFDIFLYPMNTAGLVMIAILAGVPLLIELLSLLTRYLGNFNPMIGFLHIVFACTSVVIAIIIALYKYWYFGRCILDSAEGNIRVPPGLGDTPGIGELFSALKNIVVSIFFAFAPAIIYGFYTKQFNYMFFYYLFTSFFPPEAMGHFAVLDKNFYILLGFGIVIFPMGILSVFIQDSIRGLNPVLLVKSIYKTFLPYLLIALLFFGFFILSQYIRYLILFKTSMLVWLCRRFIIIYLAIVLAHILGRFYYKNSEKLGWL